jgi:hypothetical protein
VNGGYSWAYKRAITTMINNVIRHKTNLSEPFQKEIDRKMRQALYDVRENKNDN